MEPEGPSRGSRRDGPTFEGKPHDPAGRNSDQRRNRGSTMDTRRDAKDAVIRTIAMPSDTNPAGDIFGGWLMSQMDLAAGNAAARRARGRCATVAVDAMSIPQPGLSSATVSVYADLISSGRTSMKFESRLGVARATGTTRARSPRRCLPSWRSIAAPALGHFRPHPNRPSATRGSTALTRQDGARVASGMSRRDAACSRSHRGYSKSTGSPPE